MGQFSPRQNPHPATGAGFSHPAIGVVETPPENDTATSAEAAIDENLAHRARRMAERS
jgi:hypothetical protein